MNVFNYNNIFSISDDRAFRKFSLDIFKYQYHNCTIYGDYCRLLNKSPENVSWIEDIPFLPIHFFKTHIISDNPDKSDILFSSSGTTSQQRSKHYVADVGVYEQSFLRCFELFYGNPEQYCILALLPSYLEREDSSLVYMANSLINKSKNPNSGFYLNNYDSLMEQLQNNERNGIRSLLLGVSFALTDLAERNELALTDTIIMETGGMKGRKEELTRDELHSIIKKSFKTDSIHSEYGMTELLSQAYSDGNGLFSCPPWMKVLIREINDPFSYCDIGAKGGVNIIDLANIHSCSFIETQDLGIVSQNAKFEIIGRIDQSDIRGCNLMYC